MIEAVIFDMDGLLVDSEPLWREAEKIVFSSVGINLTESDFEQFMGFKINEVVDFWYKKSPWKTKTRDRVENEILDELDFLIDTRAQPKKGLEHILELFRGKAIPLALASSSPAAIIDAVLKKLSIAQVFRIIHSAEKERFGKPHPAVFLSTARMLNVPAASCLVFEDSFNGLIAAKAARTKTVSIPEPSDFQQTRFDIADLKLRSLADFTEAHWSTLNANHE
jgi:HAD superfamily hydrolase (TIGR01509 family)